MTTDLEFVPLQHLRSLLPWTYQSLKNLRGSDREEDRKKVAWIHKVDGRLWVYVPHLKRLLLVLGFVTVAYEIDVRVEQIATHGAQFRSRGLLCSFGAPGCRGMTCGRCQSRFQRYTSTHVLDPM